MPKKGKKIAQKHDADKLYPRSGKELATFFKYSPSIMHRKIDLMIDRGIIVREPGFIEWDVAQQEAMIEYLGDPREDKNLYPRRTKDLAKFFGYSLDVMYRKIRLMIERGIIVKEPGFHDWDIIQQKAMIEYLGHDKRNKR